MQYFNPSLLKCWITDSLESDINAYSRGVRQIFSDGSYIDYVSENAARKAVKKDVRRLIDKPAKDGSNWIWI